MFGMKRTTTLLIYMKSGNIIKVPSVTAWGVGAGDEVDYINIERSTSFWSKKQGLIIKSLILSQIEAIEEV